MNIHRSFYSRIFLALGICLIYSFSSCQITYLVRDENQALNEVFSTPCGRVTMQLEGRGNSIFTFRQIYHPDSIIHVFPDSMQVFYNSVKHPYTINVKGAKAASKIKLQVDKSQLEFVFEVSSGVFDGDTIKIVSNSFFECNGARISIDTIRYSFQNPVRIHGINTPP